MDNLEAKSPENQQSGNNSKVESTQSFRQKHVFAEKILPNECIIPPACDKHDIKKITRRKLEDMLYAESLTPSLSPSKVSSSKKQQYGINRWIWDNKISTEIYPSVLKDYLRRCINNSPQWFYVAYKGVVEMQQMVVRYHQISLCDLENEHIFSLSTLNYLIANLTLSEPKKSIVRFIEKRMRLAGLIETKLVFPKQKRDHKLIHPKVLAYQKHLIKRGLSQKQCRLCLYTLNDLLSWLSANVQDFNGISPHEIPIIRISNTHLLAYRSYKRKLVKEGSCSAITFEHAMYNIRSFFLFLKKQFGFSAPLQNFRAIKAPRYYFREIPTNQQLANFFEVINDYSDSPCRDRVAYGLLLYLGLRLSEVSRVTWNDINLGNKTLAIHSKGGKEHLLPLAGSLFESICELSKNRAETSNLLLGDNPTSIANRIYLNYKLYALIADWSFPGGVHFFRHIFLSRLAQKGILPQAMKELARVQNLNTVSIYVHLGQQQLINQINLLNYK
ncbi:tyrosine recombinase XerC [Brevibacillus sp. 179-C9.3 HS]|uniref:site-specific integrase n=1 Tax=unclassified Brevibacillus TaxID=2684853 RepID=UPI0039A166E9